MRKSQGIIRRLAGILLFISVTPPGLSAMEEMQIERILLRTDRDLYITGENLHFKAFLMYGDTPVQHSDIMYLELVNDRFAPVVQKKFHIREAECDGSIALPAGLETGNYYLRAYTSWMKNRGPDNFTRQLITVINPFGEIRTESVRSIGNSTIQGHYQPENNLEILVQGLDQVYKTRRKVSMEIAVTDPDGQPIKSSLLVSVVRKGLLQQGSELVLPDASRQNISDEMPYPPEWGGHYITGRIQPQNGGDLSGGDTMLYSVVGKSCTLNYSICDSVGNFSFLVDRKVGMHEVVIQNINAGKSDYHIVLDNPFLEEFASVTIPPFRIDTSRLDMINKAVIAAQVNVLYGDVPDPVQQDPGWSFYGVPEHQVIMSDYIKLPEMWEVFFELIPFAHIRIRGDQVEIGMINTNVGNNPEDPPLLLVDGVVTLDNRDAASLDPLIVQRIELVDKEYRFGALKFPGIISFITEEGRCPVDLPPYCFRQAYEFLSRREPVEFPCYGDSATIPQPDLRNTLFWDPRVRTDPNGITTLEFYTSDEVSQYSVMVTGISSKGQTGIFTGTLSVAE